MFELIKKVDRECGTPFYFVYPERFVNNLQSFRKAFTDTEVIKLNLITKDELGILLEKDCTLGARMEDLKELLELMPEDLQSDVKKVTSEQDR